MKFDHILALPSMGLTWIDVELDLELKMNAQKSTTLFSSEETNPHFPEVKDIGAAELAEKKIQVLIVDVRGEDEYVGELGHIANSRLVVLHTLPEHIEELPKNQTIVFVCKSGGRSARAAMLARECGISDVYNLKGGMIHWNELHLPIEK